jgi:hypothetical protein
MVSVTKKVPSFLSRITLKDSVFCCYVYFQVKEVAPAARKRDARLSFAFVYPDRRGRNVIRTVSLLSFQDHGILISW